jgi:hypothetical protein
MKVELHFNRNAGIKLTDKEAAGVPPLVGELQYCNRWVSETRTLPALELVGPGINSITSLLAVLFEPRFTGLRTNWLTFIGYEVLTFGEQKQLVIQEWRCYVKTFS